MRHFITLLVIGVCSSVWASNGNNFIGASATGTAMAGTGVANFTNLTDAILRNPALLTYNSYGAERFAGEFNLKLIDQNATGNGGLGDKASQSPIKTPFSLALGMNGENNLSLALGILTYGGATADQTGQVELAEVEVNQKLFRIQGVLAYEINDDFSIGVAPFILVGGLEVNHALALAGIPKSNRSPHYGAGIGAQIGAAYNVTEQLVVGASYVSEAEVTYKELMNLDAFGPNAANAATLGLDDVKVQQPAEYALGVGYTLDDLVLTLDYRYIDWQTASGFQELGWQSQHVVALAAQYTMDKLKLRAGYNYARSVLKSVTGENGNATVQFQGHGVFQRSISLLNLFGFPGISQGHVTVGASYEVNEDLGLDFGGMYAGEVIIVRQGTAIAGIGGNYSFTSKVTQWSANVGARYRF